MNTKQTCACKGKEKKLDIHTATQCYSLPFYDTEQKCCEKCRYLWSKDPSSSPASRPEDITLHCGNSLCPCHTEQKGWREELREMATTLLTDIVGERNYYLGDSECMDEIEAFIERTLQAQREEMVNNIGMLRQWLNERPANSPLLTNEDLKHWLIKDTKTL